MKTIKSMFENGTLGLLFLLVVGCAMIALSGCSSPKKLRDIELKGMYINGYSETLAIGAGKLTSIPGDREALAAHYKEDTAWLSPQTKTHAIDIFLVGTNSVENAPRIIESICTAFASVAPTVSSNNAEVAKGGENALTLLKSSGETRKAVELGKQTIQAAKIAADKDVKLATVTNTVPKVDAALTAVNDAFGTECTDGSCAECKVK